jgi:hypothetical protein
MILYFKPFILFSVFTNKKKLSASTWLFIPVICFCLYFSLIYNTLVSNRIKWNYYTSYIVFILLIMISWQRTSIVLVKVKSRIIWPNIRGTILTYKIPNIRVCMKYNTNVCFMIFKTVSVLWYECCWYFFYKKLINLYEVLDWLNLQCRPITNIGSTSLYLPISLVISSLIRPPNDGNLKPPATSYLTSWLWLSITIHDLIRPLVMYEKFIGMGAYKRDICN